MSELKTPSDLARFICNDWSDTPHIGDDGDFEYLRDLITNRDKGVRLALLEEIEAEAQADTDHDLMHATRLALGRKRAEIEAGE